MTFEWDENKNLANIEKHGVSFEKAIRAFLDPNRKVRLNEKHSAGEIALVLSRHGQRQDIDGQIHRAAQQDTNNRRWFLA